MVKYAPKDHQLQFVMEKVEAQVLLQFIWCNKNKSFSILSLQKESVTIVMKPR